MDWFHRWITKKKLEKLLEEGKQLFRAGQYLRAIPLYKDAIQLLREAGKKKDLAEALEDLGQMLWKTSGKVESRDQYWKEAAALYQEIGDDGKASKLGWGVQRGDVYLPPLAQLKREFFGARFERPFGGLEDSSVSRRMLEEGAKILGTWYMEDLYGHEPPGRSEAPIATAPLKHEPWPDEESRKAEERLRIKDINIPWHYEDEFGDDFKVIGLRAGGVGVVFFVASTRFGEKRLYAAKTLQRFLHREYLGMHHEAQKKIADAFFEEALPWLEMGQHANIVAVHLLQNIMHPQTGRNVPFLFSEFVERGDLKSLVIKKGRLSPGESVVVGLQICDGLLHAYKHGLSVHKDLKPENIMVYGDEIYKVTDFSAGIMGTPGYMAPEQVAVSRGIREQVIDHRADQFAIGLILHDVVKGGDPGEEQRKRVIQIRMDPGRFVREGLKGYRLDDVPSSLGDIIDRCLEPRPEDRFESLSLLREELLKAYGDHYRPPEVDLDDSVEWWFNRGTSFYRMARYTSAELPLREAITRLGMRRLQHIPRADLDQATCLMNLGIVCDYTGRFSLAESYFRDALKMFQSIPGEERGQAQCFLGIGNVYYDTSQFSLAETFYKDALRMFEAIPGTYPEQAKCLASVGNVYKCIGQLVQAETYYKKALSMFQTIAGTEREEAICLMNLGNLLKDARQFPRAESYIRDALKRFEAIPGTERDQASCLVNMGAIYHDTSQFCEAETHYKNALSILEGISGIEMIWATCVMNLGNVFWRTSQFPQAETHFREALRVFKSIPGTKKEQANCILCLGVVYSDAGKFLEAEFHLKDALTIFQDIPGTEIDQAKCLGNLGALYSDTGQFPQAESYYKNALVMFQATTGTEMDQARCLVGVGILYRAIQKIEDARKALVESLKICEQHPSGTEEIKNVCLEILNEIGEGQ